MPLLGRTGLRVTERALASAYLDGHSLRPVGHGGTAAELTRRIDVSRRVFAATLLQLNPTRL
jgi:hypothetical protein